MDKLNKAQLGVSVAKGFMKGKGKKKGENTEERETEKRKPSGDADLAEQMVSAFFARGTPNSQK